MIESTKHTSIVVLLHGLGRSSRSMQPLANALEDAGFSVLNLRYPSRSAPTADLAAGIAAQVAQLPRDGHLDFVTHSLGGILLRVAVAMGALPVERIRRVVMLGPPNRGSELVDALTSRPCLATVYRRVAGPAAIELGVGPTSLPDRLPPVSFELGVIAGTRSVNPLFSSLIPRPNDGKVAVSRTTVDGMRDMLVLPYAHPFLMRAPAVIAATARFLETGTFAENSRSSVLTAC